MVPQHQQRIILIAGVIGAIMFVIVQNADAITLEECPSALTAAADSPVS
jgi:hypothetical protein